MTTFSDGQLRVLAAAIERARVEERVRSGLVAPPVRPPVSRDGAHLEPVRDPVESYWERRAGERTAAMIGAVLGLAGCFWLGVLLSLFR